MRRTSRIQVANRPGRQLENPKKDVKKLWVWPISDLDAGVA
jgi:hypothetical protein